MPMLGDSSPYMNDQKQFLSIVELSICSSNVQRGPTNVVPLSQPISARPKPSGDSSGFGCAWAHQPRG